MSVCTTIFFPFQGKVSEIQRFADALNKDQFQTFTLIKSKDKLSDIPPFQTWHSGHHQVYLVSRKDDYLTFFLTLMPTGVQIETQWLRWSAFILYEDFREEIRTIAREIAQFLAAKELTYCSQDELDSRPFYDYKNNKERTYEEALRALKTDISDINTLDAQDIRKELRACVQDEKHPRPELVRKAYREKLS